MGLFGKRFKDPVRGTAQVVGSPRPPENAMWAANVKLQLVVRADGVESHATEKREWKVPVKKWPWPGTQLPVTVDRRDPEKFDIEWDEVPTTKEVARQRAEAMASADDVGSWSGAGASGDADVDAIIRQVQSATPDVDVEELISQVRKIAPNATVSVQSSNHGVPPATGGGGGDRLAQLERLDELRKSGALSDAEFEIEKARILGSG